MAAPIMNAGADVDITFGSIPTTRALAGSATVSAPGTAIVSWQWTLLEKPSGSAAALSSTTVQNPTLNGIDTPGTYLLFLQGTDDAGQVSASDRWAAATPASAFVRVSVTSEHLALHRPAPSQRDWDDENGVAIAALDTVGGDLADHLADMADPHQTLANGASVVVADTPSAGEVLTATGPTTAEWQAAGAAATAAVGTLGLIETAEAPFSAPNPKAVVKDKMLLTATPGWTNTPTGIVPWAVVLGYGTGNPATPSPFIAAWYVPYAFHVEEWTALFQDGGNTGSYDMILAYDTPANYLANAVGTALGTALIIAAGANVPTRGTKSVGTTIPAGSVITLRVRGTPTGAGGGLSVTVAGYQVF